MYMVLSKTNPLQERAKEFLSLPIPKGMNYAPDSIAERLIVEYADNGKVNLDPELMELLQIMVMESPIVESAQPGSEDAYMNESTLILREILDEAHR
ncbi:hypothetical protein SAMN05878276_0001 [Aquipseudomonas alcaligenes]|nr:hypothetical protein SAMN05878276_0001 [Pseudomonas alcaligenes]